MGYFFIFLSLFYFIISILNNLKVYKFYFYFFEKSFKLILIS